MVHALYVSNKLKRLFHDERSAKANISDYESADIRVIEEDHADILERNAARRGAEQAEQTKRQQIRALLHKLDRGTATPFEQQKAIAHLIRKVL